MVKICASPSKGSEVCSIIKGSYRKITAIDRAVELVEGTDLVYFVELQVQEAGVSPSGTFLNFCDLLSTDGFPQGGPNACQ